MQLLDIINLHTGVANGCPCSPCKDQRKQKWPLTCCICGGGAYTKSSRSSRRRSRHSRSSNSCFFSFSRDDGCVRLYKKQAESAAEWCPGCSARENRICLRTRAYQLQLAPQTGKLLPLLDKLTLQLRDGVLQLPLYRQYLLLHLEQLIGFRCKLQLKLHPAGGHPARFQQVGWVSFEQAERLLTTKICAFTNARC